MTAPELVVLSPFRSVTEAQTAKGILNGLQIESSIRSDNAGGMYPALDSAELLVRAEDAERARERNVANRPTSPKQTEGALSQISVSLPTAPVNQCKRGSATNMDRQAHWQNTYQRSAADEVSWFQPEPSLSLRLLEAAGLGPST